MTALIWAVMLSLGSASVAAGETMLGKLEKLESSPGHQRMLEELDAIRVASSEENVYIGDARARQLRREVARSARLPVEQQADLRLQLGEAELWLGREQEAISQLERALTLVAPDSPLQLEIRFRLGVAFMRKGETDNCSARTSARSCILPIRGSAVHTVKEGSRSAIEQFSYILERTSPGTDNYLRSQWLLNLAYMTLGTFPDHVPHEYRIPADNFESEQPFPAFTNVAAELGLDTFSLAGGAVADDFDGDFDLDLVVSSADPAERLRFFSNTGDGRFEEQGEHLEGVFGGLNLIHGDYDNDGDADLLVLRGGWMFQAGRQPNSLLENRGDGSFEDVTFAAGLGDAHFPTQTAAWADYDNDGDLDLYVGNESYPGVRFPGQLFENRGDGTFADRAEAAGVDQIGMTKAVVWGDYDRDGFSDLYVSNYGGPNRLYRNKGDGTFDEVGAALGVDGPFESFPAWFWDYDNDGNLDLFVSSYKSSAAEMAAAFLGLPATDEQLPHLYRGTGDGAFERSPANLHRTSAPMGCNFGDLDGDGFLDFYLGTGWPPYEALMPNLVYLNRAGKDFVDVTAAAGLGHLQKGHAVVFFDYDNDGDQDVFEQMGGFYRGDRFFDALYQNPGFGHRSLAVILVGTDSNRSAIGARLRLVVETADASRSLYRHVSSGATFGGNPLRQFFGWDQRESVDRLEVWWPRSGKTEVFDNLPEEGTIQIVEGRSRYQRIFPNGDSESLSR